MYLHHQETITNVTRKLHADPTILGLLLGGSIAHGYARADSDVDILIVVDAIEYQRREAAKQLLYWEQESCTYEGGYVDGKFITVDYLHQVALKGNEPTRYAFKDSQVLFAKFSGLEELARLAASYPEANRVINCQRFYAQLHAWKWYANEAEKHHNRFLLTTAINNFFLYACRLVLAHNHLLYPYLKWVQKEVEQAVHQPPDFLQRLNALVESPGAAEMESLVADLKSLNDWAVGDWDWPAWFSRDVENTWWRQDPCLADV